MESVVRERLKDARRVVIKLGTSILLDEKGYPSKAHLAKLVSEIAKLHREGREVIVVSSGAIGSGLKVLGIAKRPKKLPELQMAASVGQSYLLSLYAALFAEHGIVIGQVLLTHDDLRNRVRHLNARNAFLSLLKHRVIPVVNENDVVSVDEIRVGDNDVLASLVAMLVGADALVLATTAPGFYTTAQNGKKSLVSHISKVADEHLSHAKGKGSELSTGGMSTKLTAANNVAKMGSIAAIVDGRTPTNICKVLSGAPLGTVIGAQHSGQVSKRKQWIAFFNRTQGTIIVDEGAKKALLDDQRSLLPVGIVKVEGTFGVGSLVQIEDKKRNPVARGLSEYSSTDIDNMKGQSPGDEVIHRDNIWTDL
jgi:glutamate 5-kinase